MINNNNNSNSNSNNNNNSNQGDRGGLTRVTGVTRGYGTEGREGGKGKGGEGEAILVDCWTHGPTKGSTRGPRGPKKEPCLICSAESPLSLSPKAESWNELQTTGQNLKTDNRPKKEKNGQPTKHMNKKKHDRQHNINKAR